MAQPPSSIPMSPTGETPSAPLAAVTALQPADSEAAPAPAQENAENTPKETPATIPNDEITPTAPAVDDETTQKRTGIVIHHLNNSRSQRLLWLLEELEVPYEIQKYDRTAEMRAPQEMKDVHPLGKSPIITDGDVTLAESGAITEYLLSKHGANFRPTEAGKLDDLYFTHYAEGSLMPVLVHKLLFTLIPQRSPALIRPLIKPVFTNIEKKLVQPELKAHCNLIESHLSKSQTGWLAGGDHPTSADFMMVFPIEFLARGSASFIGRRTKEYLARIHERPAYKRGLEKGGKYDYAKL